jgi:hypothetical protein
METSRSLVAQVTEEQADMSKARMATVKHMAWSRLSSKRVRRKSSGIQMPLKLLRGGKTSALSGGIQISSSIAEQLETVLTHSGVETDASELDLPAVAESVARTVLGDTFDLQGVNSGDDAEILLRQQ